MKTETRQFRMNSKLLYDVITRQAGTIEKSWLEIVQNAIDAGATKLEFDINRNSFVASDNGKGMTKEEIVEYFEEFGKSSKSENDLGEFGMGRGQIFAQGVTVWMTHEYSMDVDVKNNGLTYVLDENKNSFLSGTRIVVELYNKIKFLDKKIEKFIEWVKYVSGIDIVVNKVKVNSPIEVDFEDEMGKIKLIDEDAIKIYNRGIFVNEENLGSGAIIISSKNMKVNFARNDVMDGCEVYSYLMNKTKELFKNNLLLKQSLNQNDRKTIISLMREDDKWVKVFEKKAVIETANNNFVSINKVSNTNTIYFSDGKNSYEDDRLIEQGYLVLKNSSIAKNILSNAVGLNDRVGDYLDLVKGFRILIQKEISVKDLDEMAKVTFGRIKKLNQDMRGVKIREIRIAKNMVSTASTDGKYFITINFNFLKSFDINSTKYILLHEYSHDTDTTNTDEHGYEFYEKFYNLARVNMLNDNS